MAGVSLDAWKSWKQAQQKYDYFIVGLTTALFAYLGSSFTPEPISFSKNTFEFLALFFLVISIIFGILRLESDISLQSTDFRRVEAQEKLDAVNKILNLPYRNISLDTGLEISLTEAKNRQEILKEFVSKISIGFEIISSRSYKFFIVRNYSLLFGFVSLIISKFVTLYNVYQSF